MDNNLLTMVTYYETSIAIILIISDVILNECIQILEI